MKKRKEKKKPGPDIIRTTNVFVANLRHYLLPTISDDEPGLTKYYINGCFDCSVQFN